MNTIVEFGKAVLTAEAKAICEVRDHLAPAFVDVVELLVSRRGKVICIGVGKSAIIAQKFCATLCSLGMPSVFMHGADGPHGDLGVVAQGDIAILLSYTGESRELLANLGSLRALGARTIAITGASESSLATQCEITLLCTVQCEADSLNLAPSSSSTAMLALCDAVALSASNVLNFKPQDFALRHPGGALGRRLTQRVIDLPLKVPVIIEEAADATHVLMAITSSLVGAVLVRQHDNSIGLITDGDVRRAIQSHGHEFFSLTARDMMTAHPIAISGSELVASALEIMEERTSQISVLLVEEDDGVVGIARIHDLIGAGLLFGHRPPSQDPS